MFDQPSNQQRLAGVVSVDELFEEANTILAKAGRSVWILLDRLDVAFAETVGIPRHVDQHSEVMSITIPR